MMTAQLYLTSIDDVVMMADETQRMTLCNYNKDFHHDLFIGIHDFIRIPSGGSSKGFETNLNQCFCDVDTSFTIDQLSMVNLRLIVEILTASNKRMSGEAERTLEGLRVSLATDKHQTLVKLEKQLKQEGPVSLLKFFNADSKIVHDQVTINLIEKVDNSHSEHCFQHARITRAFRPFLG